MKKFHSFCKYITHFFYCKVRKKVIMGKLVFKLGILLCFLTIIIGIIFQNNNEQNKSSIKMQYEINAYPLKLPKDGVEKQPEIMFTTLMTSAKKYSVSVINRVENLTVEKKNNIPNLAVDIIELNYFIDPSNRPIFLNNFISPNASVGYQETLFNTNVISKIKDINTIDRSDIIEGTFFLEGSEENVYNTLVDISQVYKDKLNLSIENKELYDAGSKTPIDPVPYLYVQPLIGLACLFLLGCLIIYFLLIGRESQLLQMHGFTATKIAWDYLLKDITFTAGGVLGIFFIFSLLNTTYLISNHLLFKLLLGCVFFCLLILLAFKLFLNSLHASILNYKNYDKDFFYVIYAIKILFLVAVIANLSPLSELFKETTSFSLTAIRKNATKNEDYGVFFPLLVGKNHSDIISNTSPFFETVSQDTLSIVRDRSIIVDTSSYEQSDSLFDKVIRIDTNYLKKYPIFYEDNKTKITIDDEENQTIFLATPNLKSKISEIKSYYKKTYNRAIEIKLISNNTKIQKYNGQNQELAGSFLIEVLTKKSALPTLVTGLAGTDPLKIDLKGEDAAKVYSSLEASLKEALLSDNLITLIKLADLDKAVLMRQVGSFLVHLFQTLFSLCLTFFLIIQSAIAYFNQKKKQIIINRIHGYSLIQAYKGFFFLLGVQSIVFSLLSVLAYPNAGSATLITCILLFIFELITSILTLMKIEMNNQLHTIQGG